MAMLDVTCDIDAIITRRSAHPTRPNPATNPRAAAPSMRRVRVQGLVAPAYITQRGGTFRIRVRVSGFVFTLARSLSHVLSSLFPPVFPCGRRGACTTGACTGHRVPRLPRSRGRACVPQSAVCACVLLLSCVPVLCCVCVLCAVPAVPGTGTEISGQPSSLVQYTCGTSDLASRPPVCAVLGGDPATWHVRGPCVCCSCHLQAATSPTTCSTLHSDMLLRMPIHVLLLPAST